MTSGELMTELAALLGARHEARFIIEDVLGSPGGTQIVGDADLDAIRVLAARRHAGEPLQYVLGHWAFRALDLVVDRRVLIPRPETEAVVDVALAELRCHNVAAPVIVDAGTGSGAIALSLATELALDHPHGRVWGTDASTEALTVAELNLARVRDGGGGPVLPVQFLAGCWLNPLPPDLLGTVDLVVSNPPYVAAEEWPDLQAEVQCEPVTALVAGTGSDGTPGLLDVEAVLQQAWTWLARPGAVVIELAPQQADAAARMAARLGYRQVRVERDLAQRPRALVGRTP